MVLYLVTQLFKILLAPTIPTVTVPLEEAEEKDVLEGYEKFSPEQLNNEAFGREHHGKTVYYWDPSTMDKLGEAPAMGTEEVYAKVAKAKVASKEWAKSSFEQRRHVLKTILVRLFTRHRPLCTHYCPAGSHLPTSDGPTSWSALD